MAHARTLIDLARSDAGTGLRGALRLACIGSCAFALIAAGHPLPF